MLNTFFFYWSELITVHHFRLNQLTSLSAGSLECTHYFKFYSNARAHAPACHECISLSSGDMLQQIQASLLFLVFFLLLLFCLSAELSTTCQAVCLCSVRILFEPTPAGSQRSRNKTYRRANNAHSCTTSLSLLLLPKSTPKGDVVTFSPLRQGAHCWWFHPPHCRDHGFFLRLPSVTISCLLFFLSVTPAVNPRAEKGQGCWRSSVYFYSS